MSFMAVAREVLAGLWPFSFHALQGAGSPGCFLSGSPGGFSPWISWRVFSLDLLDVFFLWGFISSRHLVCWSPSWGSEFAMGRLLLAMTRLLVGCLICLFIQAGRSKTDSPWSSLHTNVWIMIFPARQSLDMQRFGMFYKIPTKLFAKYIWE